MAMKSDYVAPAKKPAAPKPAPAPKPHQVLPKAASLGGGNWAKPHQVLPKSASLGGGKWAPVKATKPAPKPHQIYPKSESLGGGQWLQGVMAKSGSTDPSDPYNWKGIAAALQSQGQVNTGGSWAPASGGGGGSAFSGGGGGGGSAMSGPAPSVMQAPSTFTTPAQNQAPTAVTETAVGAAGAPVGQSFQSLGRGGTFGMFDRMRNQRSPRSGLSVTPEMLRATAAARLGG
jgi:hypothetical protein